MYNKGDLVVLTKAEEESLRTIEGGEYYKLAQKYSVEDEERPLAYLPHSCEQWVIGGPAEVRMLIEDLRAALRVMEAKAG